MKIIEDVVLLKQNGYAVLVRKLNTPYPIKVDSLLAQIRRIFLDGYGVLDVRTVIFIFLRLSSRMQYYEKRNPEMSTNSTAPNTLNNEDTPSSSTIILNDNDALQIVSTSDEPTSPITNDLADELI
ncbi:hypothetical protein Tco_1310348 [Tanacetum coccineum]